MRWKSLSGWRKYWYLCLAFRPCRHHTLGLKSFIQPLIHRVSEYYHQEQLSAPAKHPMPTINGFTINILVDQQPLPEYDTKSDEGRLNDEAYASPTSTKHVSCWIESREDQVGNCYLINGSELSFANRSARRNSPWNTFGTLWNYNRKDTNTTGTVDGFRRIKNQATASCWNAMARNWPRSTRGKVKEDTCWTRYIMMDENISRVSPNWPLQVSLHLFNPLFELDKKHRTNIWFSSFIYRMDMVNFAILTTLCGLPANEDDEEARDLALDPLFGTIEIIIWRISPRWEYAYTRPSWNDRPVQAFDTAPIHESKKKLGSHRVGYVDDPPYFPTMFIRSCFIRHLRIPILFWIIDLEPRYQWTHNHRGEVLKGG